MSLKDVKPLIAALNNPDDEALDGILDQIKSAKKISSDFLYHEELAVAFRNALHRIGGYFTDEDETVEGTESVYELLYELYSHSNTKGKRFVLQFVPLLVSFYLEYRDMIRPGIEAVLVCIYNEEMAMRNGVELKWTPPKTIAGSIYRRRTDKQDAKTLRERRSTQNSPLTQNSLKVLDVQTGPILKSLVLEDILPPINQFGSQERDRIIRIALQHFNTHSAFLPTSAIVDFCDLCTKLSLKGLPNKTLKYWDNGRSDNNHEKTEISFQHAPRLTVSPAVMQEMISGITNALFKREATRGVALKALNALHERASYDLIPTILISTNALLHILQEESKKLHQQSPTTPLAETVKQVQEEERQQKQELQLSQRRKEQVTDGTVTLSPKTKKKKEVDEESSSDSDSSDESETSEKGKLKESNGKSSEEEKQRKKLEKKQKKEAKKLEKKEKKERKKHQHQDEKTLHADPNHDPEFSY